MGIEAVKDEPESTRAAIERMLGAEIAVICGGVSVGEHDHVKGALESLGVDEVFWRVALKPGKPTWFGIAPSGTLVFGLPGNPVSAMVTFLLFVRPAIAAMTGAPEAAHRLRADARSRSCRSRPAGRTRSAAASSFATTAGTRARPATRTRTCSPRCSVPTRWRSCPPTPIRRRSASAWSSSCCRL